MKSYVTCAIIATFVAAQSDGKVSMRDSRRTQGGEASAVIDDATWSQCRDNQDASVCADICSTDGDSIPHEWRRKACKWQFGSTLDESHIYSKNCRERKDSDWCEYGCVDATSGNNWWYSKGEDACDRAEWIQEGTEYDWDNAWSKCRNDMDFDVCQEICYAKGYPIPSEWKRVACTWTSAQYVFKSDIRHMCEWDRKVIWCDYVCSYATFDDT